MTTDQQGQKPALVRDTACLSDGGVFAPALWMSEVLLFPLMTDRITKASLPLYTACLQLRNRYIACCMGPDSRNRTAPLSEYDQSAHTALQMMLT